jgi:hypothetical protein
MKQTPPLLFAAAVGVAFACSGFAVAGPVWSLTWPSGIQEVQFRSPSGHSAIDITLHNATSSSTDLHATIANLTFSHNGPEPLPQGMIRRNYAFNLRLTDLSSGSAELFHFSGYLWAMNTGRRVVLGNTLTSPAAITGVQLGNNIYGLILGPFTAPSLDGSAPGSLGAEVTWQPPPSPNPPPPPNPTPPPPQVGSPAKRILNNTPEPPGLMLGAIGFGLVGLYGWRKRRD